LFVLKIVVYPVKLRKNGNLEEVILPEANKAMETIKEIKKELETASRKAIKLGPKS